MTDFKGFRQSLDQDNPSEGLSVLLQALWWDAQDNWDRAHHLAQDVHNADGAWVHAYLHRKEGDQWNANFWYQRAGRSMSSASLEDEWAEIVVALLEK